MAPALPAPDADQPQPASTGSEVPILVQPVTRPDWPKAIATVRVLTGWQVALVMVFGNCSFGITLLRAIGWIAERLNWTEDPLGFGILGAWTVGLAAIIIYAHFTIRWARRADRRARTTIIIGTAILVGLTVAAIPISGSDPEAFVVVLLFAAPSLIVQAVVLRRVYGRDGRRWFNGKNTLR